ncbi:Glycosyltransferase involved in cell wall bisynthesis [Agromyces sp. CF514]|uniref:glycosyltransferase family 4 protein n=1 Tax=Agromyces sp. CF514 TaxID=1881031 RepID=UPI0008EB8C40|nr:glycosyltransferase family 1 protein [Agromyces sp. CF514]SFR84188.1 Glycosyltransferase involved in cell wall bisynthesis [Agromyces sp. CF514]
MRVLFDGFWWGTGPLSNRQVLREFVFAWIATFPDDQVALAVRARDVRRAQAELPDGVVVVPTHLAPQGVSAIAELPFVAKRIGADVTITHNFTPAFGRSAVFIHDFMFLTRPEWFTSRERWYYSLMPATVHLSEVVFTSSATEARRIAAFARTRPVVPVGLAVGGSLLDAPLVRPEGLDGVVGFHLTVGRLNARKNLANTIIGAVESGVIDRRAPLIVVGEPGGRAAKFPAAVDEAVRQGVVRFLGRIDDGELAWLYAHADGLLFLSLDEGFGMPTLEAQAFGAPILASDIPVFREILGDSGAVYVDPRDPAAIADGLRRLPHRGEPETARPSHEYSWERSVRAMRDAIRAPQSTPQRVASSHRP